MLSATSILAATIHPPKQEALSQAVEQLKDPNQTVRDDAARRIREIIAQDPCAVGDVGESYWRKKFSSVKLGMTALEIKDLTGAVPDGSMVVSGQSSTMNYRFDDYWVIPLAFPFKKARRLVGFGKLSREARLVWVNPPKDYSGKWTLYHVNGLVGIELQYSKGDQVSNKVYLENAFTIPAGQQTKPPN